MKKPLPLKSTIPETALKKILFVFVLFITVSCNSLTNKKNTGDDSSALKPPVITPLVFSKSKKINWDTIKAVKVTPQISHFDLDKIPSKPYTDTTGFKPFTYPVEETKFDYNALPSKDFDVNKLPSKAFKFETSVLKAPKIIKSGPPQISARYKHLLYEVGEAQGLPSRQIEAMVVDSYGFVWVSEDRKIYRYDGKTLILFIPNLPANVYNMIVDRHNLLWMSSSVGLLMFDPKKGTLSTLTAKEGLTSNSIARLAIDKRQRLWVATWENGLNIVDTKSQTIKTVQKGQGIATQGTWDIKADQQDNIWLLTAGKGINIIDLANNKIKYLDKAHGSPEDSLTASLCDRQGRMWVAGHNGVLCVIDLHKNTIQRITELKKNPSYIYDLYQDAKDNVWVSSEINGLTAIDLEKRLKNIVVAANKGKGIDREKIILYAQGDNQGNIWIGSLVGLFVQKHNAVTGNLGSSSVYTLYQDHSGLIWSGNNDGLNIYNQADKTVKHMARPEGMSSDTIETINQFNDDIAICTNGGLDIIDPKAKTIEYLTRKNGFTNKRITALLTDKTGKLWIGGSKGIDVFDPKTNTVKQLGEHQGLITNIDDMIADARNNIWVAGSLGPIDIIDADNGEIKHLDNQPGLNADGPKLFLHNYPGNLWIGTPGGIFIVDQQNKTLTNFSTNQGLTDASVISLLPYDNKIYAGTNKGITVITPPISGTNNKNNSWKFISYGGDYGINKVNIGSSMTDAIANDGAYLWGDVGVKVLYLPVKQRQQNLTTRITGFNLMDKPAYFTDQTTGGAKKTGSLFNVANGKFYKGSQVSGPYNLPEGVELPYNQNYLQFHFNQADLVKLDTTRYRYILEGYDKTWSDYITETSSPNYFSLPPGDYTFKVEALGNDYTWGTPAVFSFVISPPWWQTWWARVLFVLAFIAVVWAFVYYRSLSLIREKRLLEEKVNIRTAEVMEQKEEISAQRDSLKQAFEELKNTQSQLVQREKMASLGELTAGIAHEIQNPLNFVNNFSEVNMELISELREERQKGEKDEQLQDELINDIEQNLKKIGHHGKRADFIVKGMLQHSRTSTGEHQPTNINILADEFLKLSYHGLRAKDKSFNAEMVTNFNNNLPLVNIVQQDIGRVLLNLFNNAFYAVNQKKKTAPADYKPVVSLTTSIKKGWLIITVSDNGNGIPDAIKDKIMQPFFTTKPTGEGTGLGLSLSYDIIVKAHGGNLQINSTEGQGAEFIISLPII